VGYTNYTVILCTSNHYSCDGKPANPFRQLQNGVCREMDGFVTDYASVVVAKGEVKPSQQMLHKTG